MQIVIFGAGSLGSLVGGFLACEHDVTLVGRDPHMQAVTRSGLSVQGEDTFSVHPRTTTDGMNLSGDLALVTVKSYDTPAAAASLATGDFSVVCSLQNGLGNEATLARELDCPIAGATTTYGAELLEPGTVALRGAGSIIIGDYRGVPTSILQQVAKAMQSSGLTVSTTEDIETELWRKVAINAAINPLTALAQVSNGAITDEPLWSLANMVATEATVVAQEQEIALEAGAIIDSIAAVAEATASNHSSMYRDVHHGTRTEIDAINGAVIEHAVESSVPVNRTLTALIRAWEREHAA